MTGISSHILDTALGKPVAGIRVRLFDREVEIASMLSDENGRCCSKVSLVEGVYRLVFEVGEQFDPGFYPEVSVAFRVTDPSSHYHVPLLISPFGYTTYRGS